MLSPNSKSFWIAFPLLITTVSIWGVTQFRRKPAMPSAQGSNYIVPMPAGTESFPPPLESTEITIPARTEIAVRLDQSIATDRVASGDPFFATVSEPVIVGGQTVIPQGAPVKGRVVSVRESGRLKGVAHLDLALESVEIDGNYYDLHTSTYARYGKNHKKRNWEMIGGGLGGGALIGALAGGGKGALIGLPIGAGAGVGGAALTGKKNLMIPAETRLSFELVQPVRVELRG